MTHLVVEAVNTTLSCVQLLKVEMVHVVAH